MKRNTHSNLFWFVSGIVLFPVIVLGLIYIIPALFTVFLYLCALLAMLFAIVGGVAGLFVIAVLIILLTMPQDTSHDPIK